MLMTKDTHGIAMLPQHTLVAASDHLKWRNIHASVARETPWKGTLPAIDNFALAFNLGRTVSVERRSGGFAEHSQFRGGTFSIIPSRESSHWQIKGSAETLLIYIRRQYVDEQVARLYDCDGSHLRIFPRLGTHDPLLQNLAHTLTTVLNAVGSPQSPIYAQSICEALVVRLLEQHSSLSAKAPRPHNEPSPDAISTILDYVSTNLDADLSVPTLAALAGIHSVTFSRVFKKRTGQSPHQYILKTRAERAKKLLMSSDFTIADIALQCGFASQSHLCSVVQRYFGSAPTELRI